MPARHAVVGLVVDPDAEPGHSHVTSVETASETGVRRWSVVEFVRAVRLGERFYVQENSASVELDATVCDRCSRVTVAAIRASQGG